METKDFKNSIGYLRVSTKEQSDKFGFEAQKVAIEKYAQENGYKIIDWVRDSASGVSESRDGWDRILADPKVANPPYEAVIVYKSDRVARELNLYFYFEWLLKKKGVELVSVNDGFPDVSDEYKGIIKSFILFSAEQERKNITLRTKGGRSIKAKIGGYAGGRPPFGYYSNNGVLTINTHEAEIVKIIFDLRNQGNTYESIANRLNERELYTRTGALWNKTLVFQILKNENTYRGLYRYGKDNEWIKGKHEAIL